MSTSETQESGAIYAMSPSVETDELKIPTVVQTPEVSTSDMMQVPIAKATEMSETKTRKMIAPLPPLEAMEHACSMKLNMALWDFVVSHKTHASRLHDVQPDFSQAGPQGMRTNLKHTLTTQRLFPKLSLLAQAERADGVVKANVTNMFFNFQQLMIIAGEIKNIGSEVNITAAASAAYCMLYSTPEAGKLWCLVYQVIMKRHLGAILKAKRMPVMKTKVNIVKVKGTDIYKAKR